MAVDPFEVAMLVVAGLVVLALAIFLIPKEIHPGRAPLAQADHAGASGDVGSGLMKGRMYLTRNAPIK
ncbi:MAG: hypothetical protein JOZ17_02785 [Acetobacteraceae bacterium]|nr:hypothetical protein [Acetobacteraceae bacterium]